MIKLVTFLVLLAGCALAASPDEVVVAKLTGVRAGPVARSMPPVYNHTLTLEVREPLGGTLKKGATMEASHAVRQLKAPEFPVGEICVVGLSRVRGNWRVDSLSEATDEAIARVMAQAALPRGWKVDENGKPLSPWVKDSGLWPLATEGTPVCGRSGRPALLCGKGVKLVTEKVPPEKEIQWTNPDGDGLYRITVTNTSQSDQRVVEALLRDAEGTILWDESLVVICQGTSYVVPGSDGAGRDALPVKLKPGESVSGVVNVLTLDGPQWPRGGSRVEFQICLGELGDTQSFYYLSRHHDALRKKAMGDE